jgi:hypothetical protein
VNLFRDQGADNAVWLWAVPARPYHTTLAARWWPGARYVTWVAIDGTYSRPADTFTTVFGSAIRQVRRFTADPILLSVAVTPAAHQFLAIENLFAGLVRHRAVGLMWYGHDASRMPNDAKTAFQFGAAMLKLVRP